MTRRLACCLALLLVCGLAAPLSAGTVYVPLAVDVEINGVQYATEILISNRGVEDRRFSTFFIPNGTNGTNRPDGAADEISVLPGRTIVLTNVAPAGSRGMLEISGAPQLSVAARLVPIVDGVEQVGAALPVLSSSNLIPAGTLVQLQGWERSDVAVSDFGLVNLGHTSSLCEVDVFGPGGAALIPTALLNVPALTGVQFIDVLGLIGVQQLAAVRASVVCDQPFYAFTAAFDPAGVEVTVTGPSQDLSSALTVPGEEPPPASCGQGTLCFEVPGVFHQPTSNNRVNRQAISVPAGVYTTIRAQVDIFIGSWSASNQSGLHNVFWLALERNRNLYGYVNLRGPNRNTILVRHGIGQAQEDKPRIEKALTLSAGRTYHVDYLYDTAQRVIEVTVTDQSGQVLSVVNSAPDVNRINVGAGETFFMDFGFTGENPNEPPTFGWRYENLLVELTP